jgi:hypothetical protein
MEPGLGGPDGNAENLGRLGEWQVEVEVHDHHGPLIERQALDLATQPIALIDRK